MMNTMIKNEEIELIHPDGQDNINKNLETGKNIIEFLEALVKEQCTSYEVHIDRITSLRFLYQRLILLRKLELENLLIRQDKEAKNKADIESTEVTLHDGTKAKVAGLR